ncbi:hypothetical protein DPX16_20005 [Anabarilius grahami]|uniref:Uncharacterized protein n=1 Tax=Anabarilius grahami TaxID=495550 RepID=A0A3N0XRW1_ANAGA|nr:hypothetical protein DPX16_20005 [Anabarilius grahami]
MAKPTPFSASAEDCNGFLLQCSLVLEMQPHLYPNDHAKCSPRFWVSREFHLQSPLPPAPAQDNSHTVDLSDPLGNWKTAKPKTSVLQRRPHPTSSRHPPH